MALFGKKDEVVRLQAKVAELEAKLSPEQCQLEIILSQLNEKNAQLEQLNSYIDVAEKNLAVLNHNLTVARSKLVEAEDDEIFQAYALYKPKFVFTTVDEYKDKLQKIRDREKELIKNKAAVTGSKNWTVNNSKSEGNKMVSDMQKLLLRAFNAECDYVIDRVTVSNIEASHRKLSMSCEAISKLGRIMSVSITNEYFKCKIDELYLSLDYQQKKQEEKEALKEARAQLREEAKLAKELAEARKKLEKEQKHYENAFAKLKAQFDSAPENDKPALAEKLAEAESHLKQISAEFEAVDYRSANQKAGYVYIISNIGAFGEDVYKIGMTRRLDPMERIDELGDASVPFDFDVHAMIFSDNAPALEAALHNAFADKKLNFVNQRREFFRVSLDEIKQVVKDNYDKTVEFIDFPPAEQFRQSLSMRDL